MATVSTLTTYGSMDVSQVRLHAEPTQDNHAATRLYVDTAAETVRTGILGIGVSGALDTLKEIEVFLQGDGSNMSGSLIHTMAQLQGQVTAEVSRASSAEGMLRSDLDNEAAIRSAAVTSLTAGLDQETSARTANVSAINDALTYVGNRVETLSSQHAYQETRHDDEFKRATAAESALSANLATSVVEVNARTDAGLALKLDKTGGMLTGDLAVSGMVSIGPAWRIVAVGASLEFQYSPDQGESWTVGIPFISV